MQMNYYSLTTELANKIRSNLIYLNLSSIESLLKDDFLTIKEYDLINRIICEFLKLFSYNNKEDKELGFWKIFNIFSNLSKSHKEILISTILIPNNKFRQLDKQHVKLLKKALKSVSNLY